MVLLILCTSRCHQSVPIGTSRDSRSLRLCLMKLYQALDVPPSFVDELAESGIIYHSACFDRRLWSGKLTCVFFTFSFIAILAVKTEERVTISRWPTVGTCMCTLHARLCLGFQGIYDCTAGDQLVSIFDLSGFKWLNQAILNRALNTAISARPAEAVAALLLDDDRAVMATIHASRRSGRIHGLHVEDVVRGCVVFAMVLGARKCACDSGAFGTCRTHLGAKRIERSVSHMSIARAASTLNPLHMRGNCTGLPQSCTHSIQKSVQMV